MLLLLSDGAPDVRSLFRSSEPGGAWDPSDFSHQFQNDVGTIPVTAAGDPVGLTIDKSRGGLNNLGAELVPDPELDSTSTWVIDALSWTASGGSLVANNATNASQAFASTPEIIIPGRTYLLEFTVTAYSGSGGIRIDSRPTVGGTGAVTYATFAGVGTHRMILVNTSGVNTRIGFRIGGNAIPLSTTISRVSVREIPGVHRYQTASGSRKLLARVPEGGRRNMVVNSEAVGSWVSPIRVTVTSNATADFEGNLTADLAFINSTNVNGGIVQPLTTAATGNHVWAVDLKYSNSRWAMIRIGGNRAWFDIQNGVVGTMNGAGAVSRSMTSLGNGWFRCIFTANPSGSGFWYLYPATDADATDTGTINQGSFITRCQIEAGSSATNYQRVGVNADCTEAGKRDCWGWLYDGLDDSDLTTSVDFSGTDKLTVLAAVRKNSDAANGIFVELSPTVSSNNGSFWLTAPTAAVSDYGFRSRGTSLADCDLANVYPAPRTDVLSGLGDIAGDVCSLRVNGVATSVSTDQGSGNYGNYPLFFGRRNNATNPFNGYEFGSIVRGAATSESTLRSFEKLWAAYRAGISF